MGQTKGVPSKSGTFGLGENVKVKVTFNVRFRSSDFDGSGFDRSV